LRGVVFPDAGNFETTDLVALCLAIAHCEFCFQEFGKFVGDNVVGGVLARFCICSENRGFKLNELIVCLGVDQRFAGSGGFFVNTRVNAVHGEVVVTIQDFGENAVEHHILFGFVEKNVVGIDGF
jgi:hypothetical protein